MCENASSRPEKWDSKKPAETLTVDKGSVEAPFTDQQVAITSQKREQILGLIAEGEELIQAANLSTFYKWIQESYETLEFHPTQQRQFDECCRSFNEYDFIVRALRGLWTLRAVLKELS